MRAPCSPITPTASRRRPIFCFSACVSHAPWAIASRRSIMRARCAWNFRPRSRRARSPTSTAAPARKRAMTPDAPDARPSGIGARLRAARERLGMTLTQASEKLHVEPKSLVALEAEDFAIFGAPVFTRGHIRRYSELLGERTDELVALYNETARAAQPV